MSGPPYKKGQRVGEVVHYGDGLTRTNPGTVKQGNMRGCRVKFDHRDNVMWVPNRDIVSLEPEDKESEAEVVKMEPKYPIRVSTPPAEPLKPEPMPTPSRPKEDPLIERMRDEHIDPWAMFFQLRDSLKAQSTKELDDARQAVVAAEAEVVQAEALLAECRRKVGALKLKVSDVEMKIAELTKRVV